MFRTSKSKLARATVVASTITFLLSSSAFAGFNGAGGFRGGSFGVVRTAASGSVQLGAANPIPRQKGKPRLTRGGGCYLRPCN